MRVALATVGTTGDVRPFVTLVRALVEHDHRVTAVTWPVNGSAFAAPGVRVETAGPQADPARIAAVAAEAATQGPMARVAKLRARTRRLAQRLATEDGVGAAVAAIEGST